jgi:hypothetical protein
MRLILIKQDENEIKSQKHGDRFFVVREEPLSKDPMQ